MLNNVIYITGAGRSGSTILDRTLGAIDGVASFNEMHVILKPAYLDKQICSCGQERDACDFWIKVFDELSERHDIDEMTRLAARFDRSAAMFMLATGLFWTATRKDVYAYAAFTRDKFMTLAKHAGVDTIVDSSKIPTRPLLLKKYSKLPVRTIHLIRHPVAVVSSWRRKKRDPSVQGGDMTQYSLSRTLVVWIFRQLASELLKVWTPYMRLRYEDFARTPSSCVERIVQFTPNLKNRKTGFVSETKVELPPLHSLSGNPDRFESGVTHIREDRKWKASEVSRELGFWRILLVPFTLFYGYGL